MNLLAQPLILHLKEHWQLGSRIFRNGTTQCKSPCPSTPRAITDAQDLENISQHGLEFAKTNSPQAKHN